MVNTIKSLLIVAVGLMILAVFSACESPSELSSPTMMNGDDVASTVEVSAEVSSEIAGLAHRIVLAYMSDKAWGFFGATCKMWIEEDYEWDKSVSEFRSDGRVKVTYLRHPDRILGPEELVFYVDIDTNEVEGDNASDTGRSSVAEGCDQW